jgi:hypothetical protein
MVKKFEHLEKLVDEFLANTDKLDNRRVRDEEGNVTFRNKDRPDSWYMKKIKAAFPDEEEDYGTECAAIGTCMRHLYGKYVTNIKNLERIAPKIKKLGVYVAARESQYLTDIKRVFRTDTLKREAKRLFAQSKEEKELELKLNPIKIDERLRNPLIMPLEETIATMKEFINTNEMGELGWILEAAIGSRSIDLMNPEIAEIGLNPENEDELLITGHSKVRSKEQWDEVKEKTVVVKPVGLTAYQAMEGLYYYRGETLRTIAFIQEKYADKLEDLDEVSYHQFINEKLGSIYNPKLSEAAKKLFPEVAAQAAKDKRAFASHAARAFHANASYALYGGDEHEDVYFRNRLQHAGFGSIANYKQIALAPRKDPVAPVDADLTDVKADVLSHTRQIEVLKRKIEELTGGGEEGAPKKLNVPKHLPLGIQSNEFKARDGTILKLDKFPRRTGLTLAQFEKRLADAEKLLEDNNISSSSRNLKKLGLGQRTVRCRTGANPVLPGPCIINDYSRER